VSLDRIQFILPKIFNRLGSNTLSIFFGIA
jgi:hypothetical protein